MLRSPQRPYQQRLHRLSLSSKLTIITRTVELAQFPSIARNRITEIALNLIMVKAAFRRHQTNTNGFYQPEIPFTWNKYSRVIHTDIRTITTSQSDSKRKAHLFFFKYCRTKWEECSTVRFFKFLICPVKRMSVISYLEYDVLNLSKTCISFLMAN